MGVGLKPAVRSFGRYELIEYLGCGGMSDVFVAVHSGLQRRVALKVLRTSLCREVESVGRFLREGQCAARVSHPNVVDVLDVGLEDGVPYLVMELLQGETLEQKLLREGPMQLKEAVDLLLPILEGVAATHVAGVLHRDIKPSNILLAESTDGSVVPKLVDFGIATIEERRNITGAIGPIGTPHYMSPEQARGERGLDERSDQYSVASVLYEILTGREPFEGGDDVDEVLESVASGIFPRILQLRPDLPSEFQAVLLRATAPEPEGRFGHVSEFAEALLPFASQRTRHLYVSRVDRKGVMSAHLLSGRFRADNDVQIERTPVVSRYVSRARHSRVGLTPRFVGLSALMLALGICVGLFYMRGGGGSVESTLSQAHAEGFLGGPSYASAASEAPRAKPTPTRRIYVTPSDASILLDDISLGRGAFRAPEFTDEEMHELRVSAEGHVTRILLFRGSPDVRHIALEPLRSGGRRERKPR